MDVIDVILGILKLYGKQASALVIALFFLFELCKFWDERKATFFWKEFDVYHKLVKELVEPEEKGEKYVDRQAAIIFELRNFKRYYPYSLRMLKGLREKWTCQNPKGSPRLLEELNLTIKYLEKKL